MIGARNFRLKIWVLISVLATALAFDASKSAITGVASGDTLVINQTYTLTVQARDSSGNNIAIAGEDLYAYITDPCTRGANMSCAASSFTQSAVNGVEKVQKLTDNGDGTYSTSLNFSRFGDTTVSVLQVVDEDIKGEYFNSGTISGTPDITNTSADINFLWTGEITPGYTEAAGRFTGKIISLKSGTYDVSMIEDDGATLSLNGIEKVSNLGALVHDTITFSHTFNAFETYNLQIDWSDQLNNGELVLSWDTGTGEVIIPPENYGYANDIGGSPLQISVGCPDKYEQVPSTTNQCRPACGDGFVVGSEVCDDANVVGGDGCKADCTAVEASWVCSAGSATSKSICTECTQGFYQNNPTNPTSCVTKCGDGLRVGAEACDDGDLNDGDGCKSDCTIEFGYVCSGGDANNKDSCTLCPVGFYPNHQTHPTVCISRCGDGLRVNNEVCDDGNTVGGDGCSSDCLTIESGFVCSDGDSTAQDSCIQCQPGMIPDPTKASCVSVCGDGIVTGTETCDDGNTNDGDGCSSDCTSVEPYWSCNDVSQTSQSICKPICSDGIIIATETCDDGNTLDGDGCSSDCTTVESGWKCDDQSPSKCSRDYKSIPLSSNEKFSQGSTLGITAGTVILNIIGSLIDKSSSSGALTAVNQIQLLLLLLLLDIYLPLKVVNYLRSLCSALVNFDIDWKFFIVFRKIIEWFDYPQDQDDLYMIDLESGSTLLNLNTFVTLILIFIMLSFLFFCNRKCKGIFTKATDHIEKSLNFGFYVGLIFESFIMLCLCSFSELKRFHILGSSVQQHSFYSSVVFGVLVITVIVFVCWKWSSTKSITEGQMKAFQKEFFGGLKLNRFARLYPVMFLIRRAALCLLIIGFEGINRQAFLCIYLTTTSIHCVAICVIRPYQKASTNIQEIVNEVFYVGFCAMLVWHYEEHHWNSIKTEIYFWSLLMNNIGNALFSLSNPV